MARSASHLHRHQGNTHKQDLIEQITRVFAQKGFDGATLTELAAATALSKATLYHHFPGGKREMAGIILRQAIADLQQLSFGHLLSDLPASVKLHKCFEGFVQYTDQGRQPCLIATLQPQLRDVADLAEITKQISQQFIDWHQLLADTIESLGAKPKRAKRLAYDTLFTMYGGLLHAQLQNRPKLLIDGLARLEKALTS